MAQGTPASAAGPPIFDDATYIYKVTAAELKAKAKGRVLFKIAGHQNTFSGIAVVP